MANVNLTPEQLQKIVHLERGCLAWGGTARLAPVDDLLISVERPLGIDSQGQMVASILSKKLAAGSTHLLIDIPVGPTAKAGPAHKNSPKYHLSPGVIAEGCLEALALNAQTRRFALEPIERQLADDIEVAR